MGLPVTYLVRCTHLCDERFEPSVQLADQDREANFVLFQAFDVGVEHAGAKCYSLQGYTRTHLCCMYENRRIYIYILMHGCKHNHTHNHTHIQIQPQFLTHTYMWASCVISASKYLAEVQFSILAGKGQHVTAYLIAG